MTHEEYKIPLFDPKKAKKDAIWLLIGPRNTGKSVLLQDLIFNTKHLYDMGFAICGTDASAQLCRKFLPPRLVHVGYEDKIVEQFVNTCTELVDSGKERHVLLIEDDLFSNPGYLKNNNQTKLYVNGRHWKTAKITCCQHCMFVPTGIRGNIDFVLALRDTNMSNRKRLYDYFFGSFPTFKDFNKVFERCTENYKCLVIDKTCSSSSLDGIFWYQANPSLPSFKLGKPVFFYLSKCLEEENKKQAVKNRFENLKSITI